MQFYRLFASKYLALIYMHRSLRVPESALSTLYAFDAGRLHPPAPSLAACSSQPSIVDDAPNPIPMQMQVASHNVSANVSAPCFLPLSDGRKETTVRLIQPCHIETKVSVALRMVLPCTSFCPHYSRRGIPTANWCRARCATSAGSPRCRSAHGNRMNDCSVPMQLGTCTR